MLRRWVPTIAALLVIGLTLSLGRWQLDRADEKRAAQQVREAALSRAPLPLNDDPLAAGVPGQGVVARGTWVAQRTVFLDNRTHGGIAGFHVFTPLALTRPDGSPQGPHLLVLRGWVAQVPTNRQAVPPLPAASGEVLLRGIVEQAVPQAMLLGADVPLAERGPIWQAVNLADVASWSGLTLLPYLVRQQDPSADGLLRDWVAPGDGVSKHLGYAFQWFAMALATAVFWAWATFWRPRRPTHEP